MRQPSFGRPQSWSPGRAATTPSRTMIQPALTSLKPAPTVLIWKLPSKLPARMQCSDAAGIVAPVHPLEARRLHHPCEIRLVRELSNRFDEIGIGFARAGDDLADAGNGIERPGLVDPVEKRHVNLREI